MKSQRTIQAGITARIWHHISALSYDEPFTTRNLLTYGNRSAIDNCIFRMVEAGIIHRLTRGVFVKIKPNGSHTRFTQEEIATIKANSFGRKLHSHPFKKAKEIAVRLGFIKSTEKWIKEKDELKTTYETSGPSSSFMYEGKRIYFKKTTRRKIQLGDSKAGQVIRALWYNGKDNAYVLRNFDAHRNAMLGLFGWDREQIRRSSALMPAWLSDIINLENNESHVVPIPIVAA